MNYRTQDVIAWDHLPHPDPQSRRREARVSVTPAFWDRLRKQIRGSGNGGNGDNGAWAGWLTAGGVEALTAAKLRPERLTLVAGRIYDGLVRSLEQPLVLKFESGATSPSRPALFALLLPNGAFMTLRGDSVALDVEDCFFTRAAVEAGPAHDDDDHPAACDAVIRETVRRYAVADPMRGFVLPGEKQGASNTGGYRVTFVEPERWGFAGEEPGSVWVGTPERSESNSNGSPNRRELNDVHLKPIKATASRPATRANGVSDRPADPFRCQDHLKQATVKAATGRHGYELAVATGECALFAEAESSAKLDAAAALGAAKELSSRLTRWTHAAEGLRDRLPTVAGLAAEDMRFGLLESRMEALAAYRAIDAAYVHAMDTGTDSESLAVAVDDLLGQIEAFDAALESAESCLALGENVRLLDNWRAMFAAPAAEELPWWLQPASIAGLA